MEIDMNQQSLEKAARKEVVHRFAEGKGVLPNARRNEQAEKVLVEQLTERARSGEHFPSSSPPD